jgi:DHA1 family tetracycline resistance protein-like MFS transporter
MTSLMSATSIVGPLLMTSLFAVFIAKDAIVYFPGAPFLAGAIITLFSTIISYQSLQKEKKAQQA